MNFSSSQSGYFISALHSHVTLKSAKPGLFLVIFILFTMQDKYSTNLTINDKSINGMLGSQTQGSRMEGADESTELWWHPKHSKDSLWHRLQDWKLNARWPQSHHQLLQIKSLCSFSQPIWLKKKVPRCERIMRRALALLLPLPLPCISSMLICLLKEEILFIKEGDRALRWVSK